MTPHDVFRQVLAYGGTDATCICRLHSACSPSGGRDYICGRAGSATDVADFDAVTAKADKAARRESRKSVDAVTVPPSGSCLCLIELKSWRLVIRHENTESRIRRKAGRYASDLPLKLAHSLDTCADITAAPDLAGACPIVYILLTDIAVEDDGLEALGSDLEALAGISSDLGRLCNTLSRHIMHGMPHVETRYWECRRFDDAISAL